MDEESRPRITVYQRHILSGQTRKICFLCLGSFLFSFFCMGFLNDVLVVLCVLEVEEEWELVIISRLLSFPADPRPA